MENTNVTLSLEDRVANLEQIISNKANEENQNRHAAYSLDIHSEGDEGKIVLTRYYYIDDFKILPDGSMMFTTLVPYAQFAHIGSIDVKNYPVRQEGESVLAYYVRTGNEPDYEKVLVNYADFIKYLLRGHLTYTIQEGKGIISNCNPIALTKEKNESVLPFRKPE